MTHHSWWASPRLQARCSCFSLSHMGGDMVTGPVKQCASSKALETAECCDSPKVWSNVQSCYSSGALYIVKCLSDPVQPFIHNRPRQTKEQGPGSWVTVTLWTTQCDCEGPKPSNITTTRAWCEHTCCQRVGEMAAMSCSPPFRKGTLALRV